MASLAGTTAKLGRARQYLDILIGYFNDISNLDNYGITREFDSQAGNYANSFTCIPTMPDDISLLIRDFLYNSRASLDHLIWQLVLANNETPSTRNEFPIFIDPDKYVLGKRDKICGVSYAAEAIIDGLQPSDGPNRGLWLLHLLSNVDKHRHLLAQRRAIWNTRFSWVSRHGDSSVPRYRAYDVPVEVGAVFFRSDGHVDLQVKPRIDILFTNAPSDPQLDRLPVPNILGLIEMAVELAFSALRHLVA